jgi:hypothetical protein
VARSAQLCTVVIGSTDRYEDCWAPFFQLWSRYWPDCPFEIVLVTDTKSFAWRNTNLRVVHTGLTNAQGASDWSSGILHALSEVRTPYIL